MQTKLHELFHTKRSKDFEEAPEQIAYPLNGNCYLYKPNGYGSNPRKYWVEVLEDKVILVTTPMAHGELATNGTSSYRSDFKAEEIAEITQSFHLPVHVIIPRIETGMRENHIVIEYQKPGGSRLVIDSKPAPSGLNHQDIENRINTGRQGFFNAEDCGYHVIQTIPILRSFIKEKILINQENIENALTAAGDRSLAKNKLSKLETIYSDRVFKGDEKYPLNRLISCFSFFSYFGYLPSVKQAAVHQILINISTGKDLFSTLTDEQKGAAKEGVLGKTVQEYLDSTESAEQTLSLDII
ncbi:MAG: hypothetical protein H0U73_08990 [Tatlockia sp.]|nr:hypothetical protein [Tatlockia sp.]